MIDWRVVLGALGAGMAIALWLESRRALWAKPWLGLALASAFFSASLFVWVKAEPWWRYTATTAQPPVFLQEAGTAERPPTFFESPTLIPPGVVLIATAENTPAATASVDGQNDRAYLRIPALSVAQPIVNVPVRDGRWDVSELGDKVGWLVGTGTQPGDAQAMVFAGHMTFPTSATLETGAFANLQYATYGTEVIYHRGGVDLVYEVTEISRVAATDAHRLHLADGNSILLVTCTDWDEDGRIYSSRLLVRASLVTQYK